ncbi:hypothetical protein Y032_0071g604 [Ancylostoma ceylanicum]|uniref:Uncharacterized protein n=1 Tax=Ancylostoma ceylanicum TaxID=53326 RepID=A0A016TWA5_9BILA|nr:hypothetical protein Y032_0071g604 [Ancylostoma ceylanicum]
MEAFWIRSRCPQMNRKDECLPICNELTSYLDLINSILIVTDRVGSHLAIKFATSRFSLALEHPGWK